MKATRFRKIVWTGCIVALIIGGLLYALNAFGVLRPEPLSKPDVLLSTVNTRGQFRNGLLNPGHSAYDYAIIGEIPGLTPGTLPPDDLIIIVHGFNNTPKKAANLLTIANRSLVSAGFDDAVIGFSWDANTQFDPWSTTGFHECRRTAYGNGPKLARFVYEYKARCPGTRVHMVGYSIGCRLALEAALALHTDPAFAGTNTVIDSIFLAGAAVDNEEVQVGKRYGEAIENRVGVLYNFYSLDDEILGTLYPFKETDVALGVSDIENPGLAPRNYVAVDAANELHELDSSGGASEENLGKNHYSCLGLKDLQGNWVDDGEMNLVVERIREMQSDETVANP
jgi:hypothetical protein